MIGGMHSTWAKEEICQREMSGDWDKLRKSMWYPLGYVYGEICVGLTPPEALLVSTLATQLGRCGDRVFCWDLQSPGCLIPLPLSGLLLGGDHTFFGDLIVTSRPAGDRPSLTCHGLSATAATTLLPFPSYCVYPADRTSAQRASHDQG